MFIILQMFKNVRGPITVNVLTYARGKMSGSFADYTGRTQKPEYHTRTGLTRNRILHTEHVADCRILLIVINFLVISFSVVGLQTFGSDSSDPTQPMSFPNYSDPLVANWSTGHDSITLTPSIFDSAVLGGWVYE